MAQERRCTGPWAIRKAVTALAVVSALGAAGCSSMNPVNWFEDDDPAQAATPGDPGSSTQGDYPNLSTVPGRPTPSTTPAEREALKEGLISDRANARHTAPPPAPPAAAPTPSAPKPAGNTAPTPAPSPDAPRPSSSAVPVPPAAAVSQVEALSEPQPAPAAKEAASSRSTGSEQHSGLWPNRPAPETAPTAASTSGRVGGVAERTPIVASAGLARAAPPPPPSHTPSVPNRSAQLAETTTLDAAGTAAVAPAPRSTSAGSQSSVASEPAPSSQSVIVDEDAIPAAGPALSAFTGRSYLVMTVYFAHGSSRLTAAERAEIAQVAQMAASSGAAVQVLGHSSARTADLAPQEHAATNYAISRKRAEMVAQALVRAGAPAERVFVEALGASQPEFYETMPAGEAGNRRVEILLVY